MILAKKNFKKIVVQVDTLLTITEYLQLYDWNILCAKRRQDILAILNISLIPKNLVETNLT